MSFKETLSSLAAVRVPPDEVERLKLLDAARMLVARLETPHETAQVLSLHNGIVHNVILATVNMGLWTAWAAADGGEKKLDELAILANDGRGCDASLLRRLLRVLVATNMLDETAEDTYRPTAFVRELGDETSAASWALHWGQFTLPAIQNMPQFLSKTDYIEPSRPNACPYSDFSPQGQTMFESLKTNKDMSQSFNQYMHIWAKTKTKWTDIIDTSILVVDSHLSADETPLLVDVGGGRGADVSQLLEQHPDLSSGKLILQDQPHAISSLQLDERIRVMEYDFFTPQPIDGARAYFLHAVLHDWPDAEAEKILVNQAAAMKRGHSKLLICDVVLPRTGASITQATIDARMMILMAGKERSETVYADLLKKAGLNIVKIWWDPRGLEAVIEVELA